MQRKIFWIYQLAFWTTYFLYNIFILHFVSLSRGNNLAAGLIYLFCVSYFGIPLSLLARWYYDKMDFASFPLPRLIVSILVAALLLAQLWVFELMLLDKVFNEWLQLFSFTRLTLLTIKIRVYFWELFMAFLLLLAWISIYLFLRFWDEWHKQRFETEKANLELEIAQLSMLRTQISPHFLFNSLSSLRTLIRSDAVRAEQMLSKISDFLRYSLVHKQKILVPLEQELEAARNYFDIEQVRFGDKLQIHYKIDPAARSMKVPALILHPVLDNSIKYGMETGTLPLLIEIRATREGKKLKLQIINSGHWKKHAAENGGTGTGLRNINSRLKTLYPGRYKFSIDKGADEVRINLQIDQQKQGGTEK